MDMKAWLPGIAFLAVVFALPGCAPPAPLPPGDQLPGPGPTRGYVGLAKRTAVAKAGWAGDSWRVVEEDGRRFPIRKDHRPDRLNFTIRDGVVVLVTKG